MRSANCSASGNLVFPEQDEEVLFGNEGVAEVVSPAVGETASKGLQQGFVDLVASQTAQQSLADLVGYLLCRPAQPLFRLVEVLPRHPNLGERDRKTQIPLPV